MTDDKVLSGRQTHYKRITHYESIVRTPDMYVGSPSTTHAAHWVLSPDGKHISYKDRAEWNETFLKIWDEIITNAADQQTKMIYCQREQAEIRAKRKKASVLVNPDLEYLPVTRIEVTVDPSTGTISVMNDGNGIPVEVHEETKKYIPELIFGTLLTGSNSHDDQIRYWGGKNSYGAKLTAIWSSQFDIETVDHERGMLYKQTIRKRMTEALKPSIRRVPAETAPYTRITYQIEPSAFLNLDGKPYTNRSDLFSDDAMSIIRRRVYDIAALAGPEGCQVWYNGVRVAVNTFDKYVSLYVEDSKKAIFNSSSWRVCVIPSPDDSFRAVSLVNRIFTYNGGTHVDHVVDTITSKLAAEFSTAKQVVSKPNVKKSMWVFISAVLGNPSFEGQNKRQLTTKLSDFTSRFVMPEEFSRDVSRLIKKKAIDFASIDAESKINKAAKKTKHTKLDPKIVDAPNAGGRLSQQCVLVMTEGDSAATSAITSMRGLDDAGRDCIGILPLRGKLINTRESSVASILRNKEIQSFMQMMGLQRGVSYSNPAERKKLRYGKVRIMTDADLDGFHIQCLIINMIHSQWPELLRFPYPFIDTLATPIVRAFPPARLKRRSAMSFFTLHELKTWQESDPQSSLYTIKYYKGLGTSKREEAEEWYKLGRLVKFSYDTENVRLPKITGTGTTTINYTDYMLQLAFRPSSKPGWGGKKMSDLRKDLIREYSVSAIKDGEDGFSGEDITIGTQVLTRLTPFSIESNHRAIPSIYDGLKPVQRKIMCTLLDGPQSRDSQEIKVYQLASNVASHTAYHHGAKSISDAIVNMAQNFCGSNNLELLEPIGQFGTRNGGKSKLKIGDDAAADRYINTRLMRYTRHVFNKLDESLYEREVVEGQTVEPTNYVPVIPTILVNGVQGIGTGFSTFIPQYNPRDIIDNLRRMLRGDPQVDMLPYYRGFKGNITRIKKAPHEEFVVTGKYEWDKRTPNTLIITEIPVGSTKAMSFKMYSKYLQDLVHPDEEEKPKRGKKAGPANPRDDLSKLLGRHRLDYLRFLCDTKFDIDTRKKTKSDLVSLIVAKLSDNECQEQLSLIPAPAPRVRAKKESSSDDASTDMSVSEDGEESGPEEDEDGDSDGEAPDSNIDLPPLEREWATQNITSIVTKADIESPRWLITINLAAVDELKGKPDRIMKLFRLSCNIKTGNMWIFDRLGKIRKYNTASEIMQDYFAARLSLYEDRKEIMIEELEFEYLMASWRAKFVRDIISETIRSRIDKKPVPRSSWEEQLTTLHYPMMKTSYHSKGDPTYSYLLEMPIYSLTEERIAQLEKEMDDCRAKLDALRGMSAADMWSSDLDRLEEAIGTYG